MKHDYILKYDMFLTGFVRFTHVQLLVSLLPCLTALVLSDGNCVLCVSLKTEHS